MADKHPNGPGVGDKRQKRLSRGRHRPHVTKTEVYSFPEMFDKLRPVYHTTLKKGCEMLLNAMRKQDGTYRIYEEMKAENIPLKYSGK
jgi:hypothetical protein